MSSSATAPNVRSLFRRALSSIANHCSETVTTANRGGPAAASGSSAGRRTFAAQAAEAAHHDAHHAAAAAAAAAAATADAAAATAVSSGAAARNAANLSWEEGLRHRQELRDGHSKLVGLLTSAREQSKAFPPSVGYCQAPWTTVRAYVESAGQGEEMRELWARQIEKETKALDDAVAQYTQELEELKQAGAGVGTSPAPIRKLVLRWYEPMREAIEAEYNAIMSEEPGLDRTVYAPSLLALEHPEEYAVITITGVMNALLLGGEERMAGQAKVTKLSIMIGKMVALQANLINMERGIKELNTQRGVLRRLHKNLLAHCADRPGGVSEQEQARLLEATWADGHASPLTQEAGMELRRVLAEYYELLHFDDVHDNVGADVQDLLQLMHKRDDNGKLGKRLTLVADTVSSGRNGGTPQPAAAARLRVALEADLWRLALVHKLCALSGQYEVVNEEKRPESVEKLISQEYQEGLQKRLRPRKSPVKKGAMPGRVQRVLRRAKYEQEYWRPEIQAKVGAVLLKLLVDSATVTLPDGTEAPAFMHDVIVDRSSKGSYYKKVGTVMCHDEVLRQIEEGQQARASMLPRYLPMLVPPLPWMRRHQGGHLTFQSSVMRVRSDHEQNRRLKASDAEMVSGRGPGMGQVYAALNALGSLGWRINGEVLDVVEAMWAGGGGVAGLVDRNNLPEPMPPPSRVYRLVGAGSGQLMAYTTPETPAEAKVRYSMAARVKKRNAEMHSLRCDTELKLRIAQEYREDEFYYPHNVDFRGRAYPMHPHLNHLGSDLCRGVMRFAEPRPLGPTGLDWLQVQVANLYGAGKLSLKERVQFTRSHLHKVYDSADNPLGGNQWWLEADEPFQCLAACKEVVAALSSGDPESFASSLPVYQDGSCNGLQHYAALGRDLLGGRAVNLVPMDRPQDVYTEIAKVVQRRVEDDAAKGERHALALLGNIDRKLVKQTVMTSVYGVTFIGARGQIGSRLIERGWEDNMNTYKVACYAAKVTLEGLHEMFANAKEIMNWLSECARLIAKEGKTVEWKTPLGLPVVQPYRKRDKKHVRTILQRVVLSQPNEEQNVMKARQRSAFPPNYVHSIDSSHMMMTAIRCKEEGLSFAGVHDSFWTHAGSVERMNEILRECFVRLHGGEAEGALLQRLLEDFRSNPEYEGIAFPEVPTLGDLDVDVVKNSQYFFS